MHNCNKLRDDIWEAVESGEIPGGLLAQIEECQTCRHEVDLAKSAMHDFTVFHAVDGPDCSSAVMARIEGAVSRRRAVWNYAFGIAVIVGIVSIIIASHRLNVPEPDRSIVKREAPNNSIAKNQPSTAGHGTKPVASKTGTSNEQMAQMPKAPKELAGISVGIGAAKQTVKPKQSSTGTVPIKSELSKAVAVGEPLVVITALHFPVTDGDGKALAVGSRLSAGTIIITGKDGRVTLVTRKGAELCLDSNSESSVQSGGIVGLRKGRLYLSNRAKEIAQINTSAGKIKLLGTVVDTAVVKKDAVAVTVVEGRVQLINSKGKSQVDAGKRSVMMASLAPESGKAVNTVAETAWYEGRRDIVSDFGDIAYTLPSSDRMLASEVWVMKSDGTNKRRIQSYIGSINSGPWLPGQQRLQVDSNSVVWTTPDLKERRGHANAGHPIIKTRSWLLNAATGQDMLFELPKGYNPLYTSLSPDITKMAFCGWYSRDPDTLKDMEAGVWIYDINTGEMRKVLDGWIKTPVTWSPDSRRIAVSTGEDYGTNHPLVVVDTVAGDMSKLNVQGAGASFSPDGTKLAYCGEFTEGGSWYRGVPTSGSIWVKDLTTDAEPARISPSGEGALNPHWSPDGTRVVYDLQHWEWSEGRDYNSSFKVVVANADGSGCRTVYEDEGELEAVSWDASGQVLYVSNRDALLIVAPDGSGVKTQISYKEGNTLSPEEKAQTEAAVADVREAVFQYALGKVRNYEGDVAGTVECFQKSSDLLAELVWKYPLSGFSADDTAAYADNAAEQAAKPAATILSESCKERTTYLSLWIGNFVRERKRMPASISGVSEFALSKDGWKFNWLSSDDKKHVEMIFNCPVGLKGYVYKAPTASDVPPKEGDLVFSCPNHPENRILWDEGKQQTWNKAMKH